MPAEKKPPAEREKKSRSGPRLSEGKKQMLVLMDEDVILDVKIAALQDKMKMSQAVEKAVREWLDRRKEARGQIGSP